MNKSTMEAYAEVDKILSLMDAKYIAEIPEKLLCGTSFSTRSAFLLTEKRHRSLCTAFVILISL